MTTQTYSPDVDAISSKLASASAIIDLVFILDSTGSLEDLCGGSMNTALGTALEMIVEARDLLNFPENTAPELHQALRAALVVVSGCNADGSFNEQEQVIRAALAKAEGGHCPGVCRDPPRLAGGRSGLRNGRRKDMSTTNTPNPTSVIDVAGYLRCCSEGFDQVAAILKTIETEAPESSRLRTLAGAGRHIADDIAELAGCWQEEVEKNGVTMK